MNAKLSELYRQMRALHAETVKIGMGVDQDIRNCADVGELADSAYALREIGRFAEDIEKRCNSMGRIAENVACAIQVQFHESGEAIKTDHCTATPKMRTIVSLPSRKSDPEKFRALMTYFGVPEAMLSGEKPAIDFYWPGLIDKLNQEMAEGRQLPPGIDPNKTWPEYSLVIRGKKSPADDGLLSADSACKQAKEEVPF